MKILNNFLLINQLLIACLLLSIEMSAFSLQNFQANTHIDNQIFMIKLTNGDIISAKIVAVINSIADIDKILNQSENNNDQRNNIKDETESFIPFIIVKMFDEEIFIYEDEIMTISVRMTNDNTFQWQNHSYFLMPTANPISNNHFAGNYELFFIMGGVGISDYLSIIGGQSFIPFTTTSEQISLLNAKVSLPHFKIDDITNIAIALGYNYGQINKSNKLHHLYGIATWNVNTSNPANVSVGMFYKTGSQLFPSTAVLFERQFLFDYPDEVFGLCGGFERHFQNRKDLSLILEIWNTDVVNAANTAILLGLRLAGKNIYADFGLSVITYPFVAPFFSFVWLPFSK